MDLHKFKLFTFVCMLPNIFAQNLTNSEPNNATQTETSKLELFIASLESNSSDYEISWIQLKTVNDSQFKYEIALLYNQSYIGVLRTISLVNQLSPVSCHHYALGLTSLINEIESEEGAPFPEILSFPKQIPLECLNNTETTTAHNQIQNLTSTLINNWTEKLVKGNFKSILEYIDQTHEIQHDVQQILPDLISKAASYEKPLHIYGFIDNMFLPEDKYISYLKLYEMFGNLNYSEHQMELAYGLYKLSQDSEFNQTEDYNSLVNKLPLQDKQLFWNNGSCQIFNADTNESLVPFQKINKNGRHFVYTSVLPQENENLHPWKLIVKRNHKGVLFRIESQDNISELCYSHGSKWNRRVGICKESSEIDTDYENTYWRIEPDVFGTGGYYILYGSRCRDNYLYASEKFYELGKRKIKVGKQYYASLWQIKCQ